MGVALDHLLRLDSLRATNTTHHRFHAYIHERELGYASPAGRPSGGDRLSCRATAQRSLLKARCPFHDERSPSFSVQRGDKHYHCYGCGAHGDAIQFLIDYLRVNFVDAVEMLAQRFSVIMDTVEPTGESQGPKKSDLKAVLENACQLYHFFLLHTEEGTEALRYLYGRGISLETIQRFRIGFALSSPGPLYQGLRKLNFGDDLLLAAGLIQEREGRGHREFFGERIMFPICDAAGAVIAFSARKYKESTFGGKYINTPETPLFKKSRVLFGLHFCRRRIAKEQRAIIVEGQLDALRLIEGGLNLAVAALGTAFGEGHVRELVQLGVKEVSLALDGDAAGQEATRKVGHLFQKVGIETRILTLPKNSDPDSFVREQGMEAFTALIESSSDYLEFLVKHLQGKFDSQTPSGKNRLLQEATLQIQHWDSPVMVHESLRKLARILQIPEDLVGLSRMSANNPVMRASASAAWLQVNPDRILESDLLRWLLVGSELRQKSLELVQRNLKEADFRDEVCRLLYQTILQVSQRTNSWGSLDLAAEGGDSGIQQLLEELLQKKVNRDKAEEHLEQTLQRILERNWMRVREEIRLKLDSGTCSEDEEITLAKEFDRLRRLTPEIARQDRDDRDLRDLRDRKDLT